MNDMRYHVAFGLLVLCVSTLQAKESDTAVLTIEAIAKAPAEIRSCELHYRHHDLRTNGITTRTIAVDQEKFFIDTGRSQAGFDGIQYWATDPRRPVPRTEPASFLRFKQLDTHPLNAPYLWFWGTPADACWSDLQNAEAWKEVEKRMQFQKTETIRDHVCDVFVVDYPQSKKKYTVAFSRALDGFPIQIATEMDGKPFSVGDVLETHRLGNAVVATRGRAKNVLRGEARTWIDVDVESIRLNEAIEPSTFRP